MSGAAPVACGTCGGRGCEEGCGTCEWAHAGPDSHKVCRSCGGSGTSRQGLSEPTLSSQPQPVPHGPVGPVL